MAAAAGPDAAEVMVAGDSTATINGGLLYHEVQEGKLCAVHCVNCILQGPFFSEFDLAALASDLDHSERLVLPEGSPEDEQLEGIVSHNVSLGGDFSIQVLEKALEVWALQVVPLNAPAAEASQYDPELEDAFICHLHDHWFCIRKVNGEWYNFNSLYPAPENLSKFYLSAYLATLKGSGWSIFTVRGNFPRDCPLATETSNGFGQWLTPDDAKRITESCNRGQNPARNARHSRPSYSSQAMTEMDRIAAQEEEDLNAAIAASLAYSVNASSQMDSDEHKPKDLVNDRMDLSAAGTSRSITEPGDINTEEPKKRCRYDSSVDPKNDTSGDKDDGAHDS